MRCVLAILDVAQDFSFSIAGGQWTTIGQILAPDHTSLQIVEVSVSFAGVTAGNVPPMVQLVRQTNAGEGGDARDPVHERDEERITTSAKYKAIQTTGLVDIDGSEPNTLDIIRDIHIHPQSGIVYPYRPDRSNREEITVAPGFRIGVRVFPGQDEAVEVCGYIVFNEGKHL